MVSFLIALMMIEIVLRVAPEPDRLDVLEASDRPASFYRISPQKQHPWKEAQVESLKICVVGDSFTKGVGVQQDDRYGARLERMLNLNAAAKPAEVYVRGLPGSSTFQQIPLVDEALEKDINLLILGICLNDAEDWTKADELRAWRKELLPKQPEGLNKLLSKISRLYSLLYLKTQTKKVSKNYYRYYEKIYDENYSGWGRMGSSLETIKRNCDAKNVPVLVVLFPLLTDSFKEGEYSFEYAHQKIIDHCAENNIRYLDILQQIRHKDPDRLSVIPLIDPHPNEIAHRIFAEAILNYLTEHKMLRPVYTPRESSSESSLADSWRKIGGQLKLAKPEE